MPGFADAMLQWFDSLLLQLTQLQPYASFLLLLAGISVLGLLAWAIARIMWPGHAQHAVWPELLISGGQTQPLEGGVSMLTMSISNLNSYPVQLLELAAGAGSVTDAEVAGINELLGPGRQLSLDVQLTGLAARDGLIDLYFYTTIGTWRHYRLQAKLQWQPWTGVHRILLLEQRMDAVRELASEQIERQRRQLWQKDRRHAKRFVSPLAPAGLLPLASAARSGGQLGEGQPERVHPEISDFPADF